MAPILRDPDTLVNPAVFTPFALPAPRAGKVKKAVFVADPSIATAIQKDELSGPVLVSKGGITTDEHAYKGHISDDKALLHYHSGHYADWASELGSRKNDEGDVQDVWVIGAFGENLSTHLPTTDENADFVPMTESTVCIGDIITISNVVAGTSITIEVSEPRMPCYKLNYRFHVKDMAMRVQNTCRTGWLYRVLETGTIQAGDEIRLVKRPHPEWTVARVMRYLFLEKNNSGRMKEIVALEQLGKAIKKIFTSRLEKGKVEDQNGRMFGDKGAPKDETVDWKEYRIVEKRMESSTIAAITLQAVNADNQVTAAEPGSHVRLKLGGKLVRAYSVVEGNTHRFSLGIALDPNSRGGSKFLHQAKIGDTLTASAIANSFPLVNDADKHIIIAGGIGITAFLAAVKHLQTTATKFELHFAVSSEVPFETDIKALGANAKVYNKTLGQRLKVDDVVSRTDSNTHVYCCGPVRLMEAVADAAKKYTIPESQVHFEAFTVSTSGDPFTVELKQSRKALEVRATQTLLDVLNDVGMAVDSSCEVGNCGTCVVKVCGGRVEHRGTGLPESEKAESMLSCVSRGVGHIVLDM